MSFCVFHILSIQELIDTQHNIRQHASIPLMDRWRPDYWKVAEPKPINTYLFSFSIAAASIIKNPAKENQRNASLEVLAGIMCGHCVVTVVV